MAFFTLCFFAPFKSSFLSAKHFYVSEFPRALTYLRTRLLALGLLQILRICLLFRTGVSVYIYISIYLFPVSVYTNFQDAAPYSRTVSAIKGGERYKQSSLFETSRLEGSPKPSSLGHSQRVVRSPNSGAKSGL